jgi:hypothetical protein
MKKLLLAGNCCIADGNIGIGPINQSCGWLLRWRWDVCRKSLLLVWDYVRHPSVPGQNFEKSSARAGYTRLQGIRTLRTAEAAVKKLLLTGIAALFLATGAAHTETNALGCFARAYGKAHLAEHPDQLVTAVKLHIIKWKEDEAYFEFALKVKVRGRNETLHTGGLCRGGASGLSCSVDCDGGGLNVVPRGDHAMMYLERIRMATCDSDYVDSGEDLSGGKDDRVFRLNRVNERECAETSHKKISAN